MTAQEDTALERYMDAALMQTINNALHLRDQIRQYEAALELMHATVDKSSTIVADMLEELYPDDPSFEITTPDGYTLSVEVIREDGERFVEYERSTTFDRVVSGSGVESWRVAAPLREAQRDEDE